MRKQQAYRKLIKEKSINSAVVFKGKIRNGLESSGFTNSNGGSEAFTASSESFSASIEDRNYNNSQNNTSNNGNNNNNNNSNNNSNTYAKPLNLYDYEKWNADEVKQWLDHIEMGQYKSKFGRLTGENLKQVTEKQVGKMIGKDNYSGTISSIKIG